ncbi:MAG: general secretion pathway protein GspK [Janthinobacterium lividum]
MILINVLAMVAVATSVVMLMIGGEAAAIDGARLRREAVEAMAIAQGGEAAAVAALARDALVAAGTDNATEPWARLAQAATPIDGGSFAFAIRDAQGRFNVNAAAGSGEPMLASIVAALGLPADLASRIAATIGTGGPIGDLDQLARAGIAPAAIATLRTMVVPLPGTADINVNAASADLLGVLLGDRAAGRLLAGRRDTAGFLTVEDVALTGRALPAGAGFTSDHFLARATVRIGDARQVLTSLIERRHGDRPETLVVARWRGAGAPG